jgi:superfamily II DNA or RNA helicase
VRKISEGVDIKRLRVEVIANRPTTELLFRQLIGRVVRVDDVKHPGNAMVYIAKFPQLVAWAANIRGEAESGLKDIEEQEAKSPASLEEKNQKIFVIKGATHEDGGAISDFGEQYTAGEVNAAERYRRGDAQLVDIPLTKIAYLLRKAGVQADEDEPAEPPLQIRKKAVREELSKAVRRLAIRRNQENPDYKAIWVALHKHTSAKSIDDLSDNHSIDVMRQALDLVYGWLGSRGNVAG